MASLRRNRKQTEDDTPIASDPRPNTEDNQPEPATVATVEFRDATFSRTTRDTLANLATWMRSHQHRSEYGDVSAIDDVVARWDANDATAIELPDEPFVAETDEAEEEAA